MALRTLHLLTHAFRRLAEDPHLVALKHQLNTSLDSSLPLILNGIIEELRELDMWRHGDEPIVNGHPAIPPCVADIPFDVATIGRAYVDLLHACILLYSSLAGLRFAMISFTSSIAQFGHFT